MSKEIIAAGGLVTNPQGAILWIFRRGFWDLPKGKLDEGESIETCAVREVEEETGIQDIQLHELITTTTHGYFDTYQQADVIKKTYWYHMTITNEQAGTPQYTEDIEKIEWNTLSGSTHCLSQTYRNIQEVIEAYQAKLAIK
jgi:ADP-ribose pyrophosphatase YjhB (NUDIX family)